MRRFILSGFGLLLVSLLAGCAGSQHPTLIAPNEQVSVPRYIDVVGNEVKVNTLHFPTGTYRLHSTDAVGYYYRTPRGVIQKDIGGPHMRDGGIFVSKKDPKKLRGYVMIAGGVTLVGNFSKVHYRAHN